MQIITFVCDGNTCRSPFAEKVFNFYLKKNNILGFKAVSFGINADKNQNISQEVCNLLKKYKIYTKTRKAKKLTVAALQKSSLVVCMTSSQKSCISCQNVFTFANLVGKEDDILDPFFKGQQAYEQMAEQVDLYCKLLIEKIVKRGER